MMISTDKTFTLRLTTTQIVGIQMAVDTRIDWLNDQQEKMSRYVINLDDGQSKQDNQALLDWIITETARAKELKKLLGSAR